jgi:peptidoglycan/xylan/chitin deacetylase (PgdA/CDA1 family)
VSQRALVLCYHAVSDGWDHTLSVRPPDFERQIRAMLERGYRPASADDVVAGVGRTVHVTFDDAFRSVDAATAVLERLGVPATVFACAGYAEMGGVLAISELAGEAARRPTELATLDWPALRRLSLRGIEIGSHTVSHAHLTTLADPELAEELECSKAAIETQVGRACRFLAYPYGEHDARVRAAAREAGYEAAFALPGRVGSADRFAVPRVGLWRKDGVVRTTLKSSALVRRSVGHVRGWT